MAFARVGVGAFLVLVSSIFASGAHAQAQPAVAAPAQPADTPAAPAAPNAGAPPAAAGSDAVPATPPAPKVPATGYGYSDPQPRRSANPGAPRRRVAHHVSGPIATLPGFEMLADGSSRLFVQLTQTVPIQEKRSAGGVTYVLKGAHIAKHNNERPLVTVHFNTPVSRAHLVPSGNDLLFVVDLRASATPTWKIDSAKEGGAILAIDFPQGNFVPNTPAPPPPMDGDGDGNNGDGDNGDGDNGDGDAKPAPPTRASAKPAHKK